ncbi:MAG: glycosyltransferase family A protein [Dysosmobacter sp.]
MLTPPRIPRVIAIHKPNTGVSDTRNLAISRARGTYLQFLDSDDWITPDATTLLVQTARQHDCDLVISDFYRVVGERVSRKGDIDDDTVLTREEYAAHMMENPARLLLRRFVEQALPAQHRGAVEPADGPGDQLV